MLEGKRVCRGSGRLRPGGAVSPPGPAPGHSLPRGPRCFAPCVLAEQQGLLRLSAPRTRQLRPRCPDWASASVGHFPVYHLEVSRAERLYSRLDEIHPC